MWLTEPRTQPYGKRSLRCRGRRTQRSPSRHGSTRCGHRRTPERSFSLRPSHLELFAPTRRTSENNVFSFASRNNRRDTKLVFIFSLIQSEEDRWRAPPKATKKNRRIRPQTLKTQQVLPRSLPSSSFSSARSYFVCFLFLSKARYGRLVLPIQKKFVTPF